MKTHYCKAEGVPISFEGECNWCGMKETSGFEGWYEDNEKHIDPRDMKAWLATAWDAAAKAEREACDQYEKAYKVWQDKTEWVQETAQSKELGMHRADVLKQRIQVSALVEREACAKLADGFDNTDGFRVAAAIRARSDT